MCEQHQINCDLTYFLGRTVHGGQKKKEATDCQESEGSQDTQRERDCG